MLLVLLVESAEEERLHEVLHEVRNQLDDVVVLELRAVLQEVQDADQRRRLAVDGEVELLHRHPVLLEPKNYQKTGFRSSSGTRSRFPATERRCSAACS